MTAGARVRATEPDRGAGRTRTARDTTLPVVPHPKTRTLVPSSETRTLVPSSETRTLVPSSETRTLVPSSETRTPVIPAHAGIHLAPGHSGDPGRRHSRARGNPSGWRRASQAPAAPSVSPPFRRSSTPTPTRRAGIHVRQPNFPSFPRTRARGNPSSRRAASVSEWPAHPRTRGRSPIPAVPVVGVARAPAHAGIHLPV